MIKRAWYAFVRFWVKLAIKLFYRRIEIIGADEYPAKGPVLLAPNHQNAFMDALIPAVFAPRPIHFLVRADVFKKGFAAWFFNSLNMMPVYRQRDGLANLQKNDEVFERCFEILRNDGTLLIFPEAGHLGERRLRNLSKGFARIVFGALENHEHLDINVVPVGLNYSNYHESQARLLINFGAPIPVSRYLPEYRVNPTKAMAQLRSDLQRDLAEQIVHIERPDASKAFDIEMERILPFYLQRASGFTQPTRQHKFYQNRARQIDLMDSQNAYFKRISIYDYEMNKRGFRAPIFFIAQKDPGYWLIQNLVLLIFLPVFGIAWLLLAPTYFTIKTVLKHFVNDKQFYSSIKLVGNLILFPLFAVFFATLAAWLSPKPIWAALGVLAFFPLSVFIIRELRLPYRYLLTKWRMLVLRQRKPDLFKYLKEIEMEIIQNFRS